jgi:Circularly permutated YpsA SLOG family
VISGGQTGADQAGLRAARGAGIPTGGFASLGWETEDGPAPWLADFGLVECPEAGYPARTIANILGSDATLWFDSTDSPGGRLTVGTVRKHGKSSLVITPDVNPSEVVESLQGNPWIRVLNIAGNRESKSPGIGERVEAFLVEVFRQLRAMEG